MENIDAKELLRRFQAGKCTDKELEIVRNWLHHFRSDMESGFSASELEHISGDIWNKITLETGRSIKRKISIWPKIAIAASLLIIAGSIFFLQSRNTDSPKPSSVFKNDVGPGKNMARLTLANGKTISIDDALEEKIEQPGVNISKTADGLLLYKIANDQNLGNAQNTLQTPNGGRFQVMLPDGTKVWLNAASALTYPLSFKGRAQRSVELSGEGYFEVAHDTQHPFLVYSAGQTIQVLGTHFNIQAYSNEKNVKTTLISGAVKVYGDQQKNSKILKPGEQALFATQNILVSPGDTEQATAWVSDDFVFQGEDLHAVMRQIARWYDVEVQYEGNIGEPAFYSTISRKKKLSEILKALTLNQGVHFKLEGRRVTVMP
jgi:transmembrane sensor